MQTIQPDQVAHIIESAVFASKAISWVIGTAVPAILIAVIFIIRLEGKVRSQADKANSQAEEIRVLREKVYEPLIRLVSRFDQFELRMGERFDALDKRWDTSPTSPSRRKTK